MSLTKTPLRLEREVLRNLVRSSWEALPLQVSYLFASTTEENFIVREDAELWKAGGAPARGGGDDAFFRL